MHLVKSRPVPQLDDEPSIKRLNPTEPHESAKTFSVLDGFRMELIAHEPLLRDPVSIAYVVVLNNGKIVNGVIASQTPGSLNLKREKGATVTILRKDIDKIKSSGKSLMPEGLEKNINHQQMADLLQFLLEINERI